MTDAVTIARSAALALLGLPEDASGAEITRAYRRLAKRTHPDLTDRPGGGDLVARPAHDAARDAGHRFAALSDAYHLLISTSVPPAAEAPQARSPVRITVRFTEPTTSEPRRAPIVAGPVRVTPLPRMRRESP